MSKVSTDLSKPLGLETDEDCNSLYIADSANHRVLKYAFGATPAITTVIGTGAPGEFFPLYTGKQNGLHLCH